MADQPLVRPGIHDGKSPENRRRNMRGPAELEDDLESKPVGRGRGRGRGRGKQTNLYPDLSERRDLDVAGYEKNELDKLSDHVQDPAYGETVKYPGLRKRKDSPARPAPGNIPSATTDGKTGRSNLWLVFLGLGILILVGLTFSSPSIYEHVQKYFQPEHTTVPDDPKVDYYELFKPKFIDLTKQFPSQSTRFWKVVGSPLRRLLNTNDSEYPAILLVGVPAHGNQTASCFSKKLVDLINSLYDISARSYINAIDVLKDSPSHTKLELDNALKQVLSSGQGVVSDHIEKLPAEGALLLHGYCDGDNAPYKTAVIVLIFHTDKDFASLDDRSFEDHLTELWQEGLGPDEMPALRSRVANSVVIVKPEANVIC